MMEWKARSASVPSLVALVTGLACSPTARLAPSEASTPGALTPDPSTGSEQYPSAVLRACTEGLTCRGRLRTHGTSALLFDPQPKHYDDRLQVTRVNEVASTADGTRWIASWPERGVVLFTLTNTELRANLLPHTANAVGIDISGDGTLVAVSQGQATQLFRTDPWQRLPEVPAGGAVKLSRKGQRLIVLGDGRFGLYDIPGSRWLSQQDVHVFKPPHMVASPSDARVLALGLTGDREVDSVYTMSFEPGAPQKVAGCGWHTEPLASDLVLTSRGPCREPPTVGTPIRTVAALDLDAASEKARCTTRLMRLTDQQTLRAFPGCGPMVVAQLRQLVAIAPTPGSLDQEGVHFWHLETGLPEAPLPVKGEVESLHFIDHERVLLVHASDELSFWSLEQRRFLFRIRLS